MNEKYMCVNKIVPNITSKTDNKAHSNQPREFPLAPISKSSTIIDLINHRASGTTSQGERGNYVVMKQHGYNHVLNLRRFTDNGI
ncbi:hypothetical protein QTG54_001219 [Skeletonema marinoi]|uniref:Uncharacterized protein n=1 Tax=Skeletonema marinoi TaxID=267567 RepID=A0AAD9DKM7_9STRA|nr:hypothetical protein QTG54_001219 [Skeletonema marinoi]